jgi:hypothetical protein
MPRLQYSRSERTRRKHATTLLDNRNASPSDQAEALKTLRQTEDNARRRLSRTGRNAQPDEVQPEASKPDWMTDYTPTAAQQAVIDRLLEDGNEHEAEVWFLVYQMEANGGLPNA